MNSPMSDPAFWHRIQFAFTVIYHYLFPQLTMGLIGFIVFWKYKALRSGNPRYATAARFWTKIFGLNFAIGVVTGIPMEFQFGSNWAAFTRYSGEIIGQTLAMEGMFAFFLESAMIIALVFGEKRLSPKNHFLVSLGVAIGSWASAYFILTTNAFMQHPTGYAVGTDGLLHLQSFGQFLFNPWATVEFFHNQAASLVTGAFVVTSLGAFYMLGIRHHDQARLYLKYGAAVGLLASVLVAFPTGDRQAKMVARYQEVSLAAMEGRFQSGPEAELVLIGQPDVQNRKLDNPIIIPEALSFLAYGTFHGNVRGLGAFPQNVWPGNIELLYYSFHIMAGLGTVFIIVMGLAVLYLLLGRLESSRFLLWVLMLAFPFPYIANTAGWMTTELGRQPWLIYGLFRTEQGYSHAATPGSTIFTLIGFCGLYLVLGFLFFYLIEREIEEGPEDAGD